MKLLVGKPPQTVADLVDEAGITRTAVIERLNQLVAGGFVTRDQDQSDRGRPCYLYSATDAALAELFPGNQQLLVPALWCAIEGGGGTKLKKKVRKKVSLILADHYNRRIKGKTPLERFRELAEVLREDEGNLVEIEEGDQGRFVMRRHNCSFFSMFEDSRTVCHVDEEMLTAVIGAPVKRTASRHDGAPCCIFEIVDDQ